MVPAGCLEVAWGRELPGQRACPRVVGQGRSIAAFGVPVEITRRVLRTRPMLRCDWGGRAGRRGEQDGGWRARAEVSEPGVGVVLDSDRVDGERAAHEGIGVFVVGEAVDL